MNTLAEGVLVIVIVAPALAGLFMALAKLVGLPLGEYPVQRLCAATFSASLLSLLLIDIGLLSGALSESVIRVGVAFSIRGYDFKVHLILDKLSATFLTLDFALCGLVGAFSARYLHQEEGYDRFFLQLFAFAFGIALIAAGGGLDLVFVGWEIVGLTSALLIAFFIRRKQPVENGLKAYSIYRISDAALLLAVAYLHHAMHGRDLIALSTLHLGDSELLFLGTALVIGAMGKGAIFPLTAWLPRAMEGPTPSSAIFYGALSVHASPFLLLRVFPLLESSPTLRALIFGLGLITALYASLVGRTQSDVKNALAYAAASQIGLIWIEIACGFTGFALLHLVGHSVLRTWQLLRAPSLLHDRHRLTSLKGEEYAMTTGQYVEQAVSPSIQRRLYQLSLERFYLDELLFERLIGWPAKALRSLGELDKNFAKTLERKDINGTEQTQ